jgi:hypothetical protein
MPVSQDLSRLIKQLSRAVVALRGVFIARQERDRGPASSLYALPVFDPEAPPSLLLTPPLPSLPARSRSPVPPRRLRSSLRDDPAIGRRTAIREGSEGIRQKSRHDVTIPTPPPARPPTVLIVAIIWRDRNSRLLPANDRVADEKRERQRGERPREREREVGR